MRCPSNIHVVVLMGIGSCVWSCYGRTQETSLGNQRPASPRGQVGVHAQALPHWVRVLRRWSEGGQSTGLLVDAEGEVDVPDAVIDRSLGSYWPEARLAGAPNVQSCGSDRRYWYRWTGKSFGLTDAERLEARLGGWVGALWARERYVLLAICRDEGPASSTGTGCRVGLWNLESGRLEWVRLQGLGCYGALALVGPDKLACLRGETLALVDLVGGRVLRKADVPQRRYGVVGMWARPQMLLFALTCAARAALSLQSGRTVWMKELCGGPGREDEPEAGTGPSCDLGNGEEFDPHAGEYYDRKSGRVTRVWKDKHGNRRWVVGRAVCVGSEVYVDGEFVHWRPGREQVESGRIVVARIDARSGKIVWARDLRPSEDPSGATEPGGALLVARDSVLDLLPVYEKGEGWREVRLAAFDRRTGRQVWRTAVDVSRWRKRKQYLHLGLDWQGGALQIWTQTGDCAKVVLGGGGSAERRPKSSRGAAQRQSGPPGQLK